MGLANSVSAVRDAAKDQAFEVMSKQREMGMAISIAQTRDMVQYMAGVWCGLAGLVTVASIAKKQGPGPAAIPLVVLPLIGFYQADMAYGTKLQRVVSEAEHILEHERDRLVPPKQAPFYNRYKGEVAARQGIPQPARVGDHWPTFVRQYLEK